MHAIHPAVHLLFSSLYISQLLVLLNTLFSSISRGSDFGYDANRKAAMIEK